MPDSEGQEGKFYTWTIDEIKTVLGADAILFIEIFNLTKEGNFEVEVSKERNGANIPHLLKDLSILAKKQSIPISELKKTIDVLRNKLFRVREERVHTHKDDKILTDWNSLMIAAFSIAGRVFDEQRFTNTAKAAGEFILKTFTTADGRLFHRYREGDVAIKGLVNDYSFLIWALLELYQTTFETKFLQKAPFLNQQLIKHFWDNNTNGGFYFTPDDGEKLLIRKKKIYDGAIPSGNLVAMLNLPKIARITGDLSFEEMALQINKTFTTQIEQSLLAHTMFLNALEYAFGQSFEIVIVGIKGARDTTAMIRAIHSQFIPNKILLFVPKGAEEEILQITDFVANKKMEDNKATAYVVC
ncbi:MAG: thioredoxin domain-containing protein [Candidatus Heimdallarchaeota archaeon]